MLGDSSQEKKHLRDFGVDRAGKKRKERKKEKKRKEKKRKEKKRKEKKRKEKKRKEKKAVCCCTKTLQGMWDSLLRTSSEIIEVECHFENLLIVFPKKYVQWRETSHFA
ncbi:hypothetical protein llap_2955 [Limosa lapponica baueri]|uniref:Uncharacterized protein n=1 Tax=Limosa lapponica baueri TaxID=1758121 RepID=A0A2I0UL38_LIMLA|nr:hypothetical protein llap_2955 [Limosa lapponica baueri]